MRTVQTQALKVALAAGIAGMSAAVQAEAREVKICPAGVTTISRFCYANDPRERDICRVGVRGDFIDFTDRVEILSAHRASVEIVKKGADGGLMTDCVPFMRGQREGFAALAVVNIRGSSATDLLLRLHRPLGHDDVRIPLRSASQWLDGSQPPASGHAEVGTPKVFELKGAGLDKLRLREPVQPGRNEIVSASALEARVRLTFDRTGDVSLETVLRFEGGASERQADEGWPIVRVGAPRGPAPPQASAPSRPPAPPRPPGSVRPSEPNLLPVKLFPERPLLHKVNTLASTMVPITFCAGLRGNETREVDLPDFEWGVSNTNVAAVTQAFTVTLTDAASNRVLQTVNLTGLLAGESRTVRNWPGRPARIRVVFVDGPPLLAEYQNSRGCYLPNGSNTPLDPRPLRIRVDAGNQVGESNAGEADNELLLN